MILEMKNIRKSFGSLQVLRDISLCVDSGEVVSIIGPSGSGKSTLLRCATFLERVDGGEIRYLGRAACTGEGEYASPNELRELRRAFGLVFQSFNLFPHYSVLKNITEAPMLVQKRNKEEVLETAMGLLRKMGLESKCDAYPCQLSGGQQQRVAIARALINKPAILFADEPSGNLDSVTKAELHKLFFDLRDKFGQTIIIATHDPELATMCDRSLFMRDGLFVEE